MAHPRYLKSPTEENSRSPDRRFRGGQTVTSAAPAAANPRSRAASVGEAGRPMEARPCARRSVS